jgi:U3 small nucleolar RNA-associated protein 22
MAPPVTKRRKLEHSESEAESEGSFADFDETNGMDDEGSDAEDASETSNVDMNGLDEEDEEEDEDMEDEEGDAFEEEADVHPSRKQTPAGKATSESKPPKRAAPSLQDGVYTAETFKSNIFKLQVDELLEQVKLKYGKKEAPAENAMRTLKTIIEQIPSRDALPVCTDVGNGSNYVLTLDRLRKPKKPSNLLESQSPSQVPPHRKMLYTRCSTSDLQA